MSNGYLLAAAADLGAAHEIADGFGLHVIDASAVHDAQTTSAALAAAPNVGLLLSVDASRDEAFVALLGGLATQLEQAQLILVTPEARAAFAFLPDAWPIMPLDEARLRASELLRRRQAEAGAGEDETHAAPLPSAAQAEPAPAEEGPAAEAEPPATQAEAGADESDQLAGGPLESAEAEPAPAEDAPAAEAEERAPQAETRADDSDQRASGPPEGGEPENQAAQESEIAADERPAPAPSAETAPESEETPPTPQAESSAQAEAPPAAPPSAEPPAPPRPAPQAPAGAAPTRSAPAQASAPADATAFAPGKLRRSTPELVRIVVHQPKDLNAVIKAAKKIDPRAEPSPQGMSIGEIALGANIGVALEVRGGACEGGLQRRAWTGEPVDFSFAVEADPAVKQVVLLARVFVDDAQIGVLAFTRKVSGPAKKPHGLGDRARLRRHKRVFLSYSSQDRETVSAIATAYQMAGVQHFWDRASLKSGEEWSPRLRREIDRADLFHLCWSRSAAQSEWVRKEAEHALTRRRKQSGKPEITVQMLDGPPWAPHPPELGDINFDDFVRAAIVGYARGDGSS
jgi:hypothetical protein